jgi:hypothetical protein
VNLNAHLGLVIVNVAYLIGAYDIAILLTYVYTVKQLLQILAAYSAVQTCMIDLLLEELGVCKAAGHLTVIGKKQNTCSIAVKTAYGINSLLAGALDIIHNGLALLRIIYSGNAILRLVEKDINLSLDAHQLIMEQYVVTAMYLGTQFCYGLAVNLYYASLDEFIGLTT